MADFSYTQIATGNVITLPNAPEELLTYTNYIVVEGPNVYIFCFDKVLECRRGYNNGHGYIFNKDNGNFIKAFRYYGDGKWYDTTTQFFAVNYTIAGFSDSLLKYQDLILTYDFYIDLSLDELSMFTLRPIVQEVHEKENFLSSTFNEIFSILPVLITVLISFIGIRKGISFLISQMKKS